MIGQEGLDKQEGLEGRKKRTEAVTRALYYLGRFGQLIGMWILLVDVFTAGPLGPNPRLFAIGVAVFLAGWGLTKTVRKP